jgi:bacterioferritin
LRTSTESTEATVTDGDVVEGLNAVLTIELTAINMYFLHAKTCEHWGYARLAKRFRDDSFEEMRDAEVLTERILFLGGLPNYQRLGDFSVGETVVEQLELAADMERKAVRQLETLVETCERLADIGTRSLVEPMVLEEQHQLEWLTAQLGLVEQLGEQLYLAQQVHED